MTTYLKFIKYASLLFLCGFGALLLWLISFSDSLTIGGELMIILAVLALFYFLIVFFSANALSKKEVPNKALVLVVSILFFFPVLFSVIDFESFFEFLFSGVHIDMR